MQNISTPKASMITATKKLTFSGITMAVYVIMMFINQSFAFGQYQIRFATSLYALAAIHPFLILPLGLANFLSNTLMGGLGPMDMLGGFAVGILTAAGCYFARKIDILLVSLPILLIPTLMVPIWLSYLLQVPYGVLALSLGIGQILPSILGVLLVKHLEKILS
ncbi:MAG TPA: QueT transporter family protein [Peptococcaceae bacterium]|nr:QueT transporter family protein [Peptococcaceae bacterium]